MNSIGPFLFYQTCVLHFSIFYQAKRFKTSLLTYILYYFLNLHITLCDILSKFSTILNIFRHFSVKKFFRKKIRYKFAVTNLIDVNFLKLYFIMKTLDIKEICAGEEIETFYNICIIW